MNPISATGLPASSRPSENSILTTGGSATSLERHGTLVAVAAFGILAVAGILARPILPVDETRYLAVAWEMRVHGDWLVPHLNGEIYSHKPPLLFWLINLVWTVTGVSGFAGRLVAPAFGAATIVATAGLARRLWPEDPGAGGRAALVLAGFAVFSLFAGLTMFDSMLALATVLGVRVLVADRPRGWIGLGAALAFGAFAKGPVILLHLLPVALATPLWLGDRWRDAAIRAGKALALGLALVGLWLVPAILVGGRTYRESVLWTQSAGRVVDPFAHGRPVWWFLALLPLILWPWIWSGGLWRGLLRLRPASDRGLRLALIWALATLAIFSLIASKQLHYLLPAMPAAALIFSRAVAGMPARAQAAALVPLVLALALVAGALGFGSADLVALTHPVGGIVATVLLLLLLTAAALRLRGPALAALGPGLVLALDLAFPFGAPGRLFDSTAIARLIAPHDGAVAVLWADYEAEFSFAARLRHPVTELRSPEAATDWLATTPDGILIARLDHAHPDTDPAARIDFNQQAYGLWTSPAP